MGLGNPLMGDDGVGVRVAEELRRHGVPPHVDVYEAETPGLLLITLIEGYDKAVLIDALRLNGPPGTVYRLEFDEEAFSQASAPLSMHDIDAVAALRIARRTGRAPREVVIVGVEPKRVELGAGLSGEVERAIPRAVEVVLREVEADGG